MSWHCPGLKRTSARRCFRAPKVPTRSWRRAEDPWLFEHFEPLKIFIKRWKTSVSLVLCSIILLTKILYVISCSRVYVYMCSIVYLQLILMSCTVYHSVFSMSIMSDRRWRHILHLSILDRIRRSSKSKDRWGRVRTFLVDLGFLLSFWPFREAFKCLFVLKQIQVIWAVCCHRFEYLGLLATSAVLSCFLLGFKDDPNCRVRNGLASFCLS